jgi:hypothetical protein
MKKFILTSAITASVLLVSGCDSDNDSNSSLQAVHASKDAPLADITINGSKKLTGVDFGQASGYLSVLSGVNTVKVEVALPGGQFAEVIPSTALTLSDSEKYTIIVVGEADSASSSPVDALVVSRSAMGTASSSSLDVQVVHASAGVPDVDLYVTQPGADITTETAIGTLSYKMDSGVINIADGSYQIRLTLSGTKDVVFDSGSVALAANSELTIAAIPNTNEASGSAPVKLLVMDGESSSILHDSSEQAQLRVGHLVYDAPQVDVALDGNEAISDLDFKDISSPYADIAATSYDVSVYAGDDPAGLTVIDAQDVTFSAGTDYSVYAVDLLASIEPLIIQDERRKVATSAVLNVLHGAQNPAAASVDVYLTDSTDFSASEPAIENFAYKQSIQQLYVAEGSYYVTVTAANDNSAVIGPASITVENGKVYQAIAVSDSSSTFDLLVSEITE